ncbi:zinc finger C2H2 domain-containing protein [Candidatus Nitrososphaera gargensis Ga9.2]|uniref:Zinc finger C2H2 domain-containing protein n=1 Tax=Nitrososphaera gargensis (strain Ga9.2) TaxID=1237085 RepID=K0IJN9_NITGG|nr:hypothetical protein [Candidatus Nitrososphaera gargensis]AFU58497.1 zinc finger C2H2 domain-containing protein [Candidatus Nitrososphaera gargensis Ga9.2]
MTEKEEDAKSGTVTMKISSAIRDELKKIAEASGKSLHQVTEEVFFAKLAIQKEQDGAINKADAECSVFELAIKYKVDVIKQLTAAANLKLKMEQIALTHDKREKLKNGDIPKIEYRNKYCCPQCGEAFAEPLNCMSHFNEKHERQEQESKALYLCPYCPTERLCTSAGALQAHFLTEHKDRFNPPPSPIQRPIPNSPTVQEKIIYQDREVKVYACMCGKLCKDITELGTHYIKCEKIKIIAGRVSA